VTIAPKHHRLGVIAALAWLLIALARPVIAAETPNLIRLEITIGKSQVVELKEPFSRVSVTNPAIADVFVITPTQILINGKAVGVTSLVVFYPTRTMFFDVTVQTDVDLLRERLAQIAPRDNIQVYPTQDSLVMKGSVSSSLVVDAANEVATAFAPKGKIINLLTLTEVKPQQVMLNVHVAEVARSALRELGFQIRAIGSTIIGAAVPGTIAGPAAVSALSGAFTEGNIVLSSPKGDYAGVVRALAERNLLRTLAKPNLVTESGKEAKFISGGEFPYTVSSGLGTVQVEFKEFGISLVFTPVVVDGETINLRLAPNVSELDFANGVRAAGIVLPAIRKRQAFTTVNLKDGESFAIAGLISNNIRQLVDKIPLLGDIPILGALFRSSSFRNDESELIFLVTAKIVNPVPPGPAASDPLRLMDLRQKEFEEFTLIPGVPGVGNPVDRPVGQSILDAK
jgi:pilus assembly protein CpaC